jgi:tetratricopeptide (TPR) repeat protein
VTVPAVAALAGKPVVDTERALAELYAAQLVQRSIEPRLTMHDLVRGYAAVRAEELSTEDRSAAIRRYLDWCVASVRAAVEPLTPQVPWLPSEPTGTVVDAFADVDTALDWLGSERSNLVAAVGAALDHGEPRLCWQLAAELWRYFYQEGSDADWIATHEQGLQAARALGDRRAEAALLTSLGLANVMHGDVASGARRQREVIGIGEELADDRIVATATGRLGYAVTQLGDNETGVRLGRRAAALHAKVSNRYGQMTAVANAAFALIRLGRYPEAIEALEISLAYDREQENPHDQAVTLSWIGMALERSGRPEEAVDCYTEALESFRAIGNRRQEAMTLAGMANAYLRMGRTHEAFRLHRSALDIALAVRHPRAECSIGNALAATYLALGDHAAALRTGEAALAVATAIGDLEEAGEAHFVLARALDGLGNSIRAAEHWRLARAIFDSTGSPNLSAVRGD